MVGATTKYDRYYTRQSLYAFKSCIMVVLYSTTQKRKVTTTCYIAVIYKGFSEKKNMQACTNLRSKSDAKSSEKSAHHS